jgi:serine/threonine protein kinase
MVIIVGVAAGMRYMHSRRVRHYNLSLSNILLDDECRPVIIGFGCSREFPLDLSEVQGQRMCGAIAFAAPEVSANELHSWPTDYFSFGLVVYTLLTGDITWSNHPDIARWFAKGGRPEVARLLDAAPLFVDTVCALWDRDPRNRPPFSDVLNRVHNRQVGLDDVDWGVVDRYWYDTLGLGDGPLVEEHGSGDGQRPDTDTPGGECEKLDLHP